MNTPSRPPLWFRAGSIIGPIAILATVAYFWFNDLSLYATGRPLHQTVVAVYDSLHETAIHTSDTVTPSDLAMFTLSLVVARALYSAIDAEQWHRDKKRLRLAYEFVRPKPISQGADAAHADRLLLANVHNRPSGI